MFDNIKNSNYFIEESLSKEIKQIPIILSINKFTKT